MFAVPLISVAMFLSADRAPPITAVAFTPEGKSLVAGSQAGLWTAGLDGEDRQAIATELKHVHDLRFSPTGERLAVAGGAPGESGEIEVYAWPSRRLQFRVRPHADLIYAVDFSPDGKLLATAGFDRDVKLLDAASGETVRTLRGHSRPVLAVVFLPDGQSLVSAGVDQALRVWDATTGEMDRALENHTQPVLDLATRPAEEGALPMVASVGEDRTVRLWQPTIGRLVRFVRLPAVPLAVAWTSRGDRLAVACRDGSVRVIDPDTVEILHDLEALDGQAYSLSVTSSERLTVAGADGQLRTLTLMNPASGGR